MPGGNKKVTHTPKQTCSICDTKNGIAIAKMQLKNVNEKLKKIFLFYTQKM